MASAPKNKLANTSLTLGLVGWSLYLLQWCFDFSIGLFLSAMTAGTSAVCATILDILPFILWLIGIVTGHVALGQISRHGGGGHAKAIWGLVLNYFGLFFIVIITTGVLLLIELGIHAGWLDKVLPFLHQ
jgi:hypothetical protein